MECIKSYIYGNPIQVDIGGINRIMIVDPYGGSGKSTLARQIHAADPEFTIISIDDLKFGAEWSRKTADEYLSSLEQQLQSPKFIIEGTFADIQLPEQNDSILEIAPTMDLILWNDIPKWISIWRKLLRSLKRYLGWEVAGTAPEKIANIIELAKLTYKNYDSYWNLLDSWWIRYATCRYMRAKYPAYINLKL